MKPGFGASGNTINYLSLFLVMMPSFLWYGYNMSVMGTLANLPAFVHQFPQLDTVSSHLSEAEKKKNSTLEGTVAALYCVGAIFGALITMFVNDIFGRRNMIFVAAVLSLIGAILMSCSYQLAQLIVGRVVLGLGIGVVSGNVPLYQTEISTTANRGKHVAFTGVFITTGILIGYWVDYGCAFIGGDPGSAMASASWRVPVAVQCIACLMTMTFIYMLPESPRWLIKRDRVDEARVVLKMLNDDDAEVEHIIGTTQSSLKLMQHNRVSDLFKMTESRVCHRVLLALFAMFESQICGINAITFHAPTIFEDNLRMDASQSRLVSSCIEIIQPIGALLAVLTVDKLGRRKPFFIAAIGMGVSLVLLTGTTSNPDNKQALNSAIAWMITVNVCYSYGFLGCCFVYASEILPMRVRGMVTSLALLVTWATNFLVVEVTLVGFDNIGYQYYIVYVCTNLFLILPVVYFFFPETKGRSLEEVEELFLQAEGFLDVVKLADTWEHDGHNLDTELDQVEEKDSTEFVERA